MNVSPTDIKISVLSVYLDQNQDPIIIESPPLSQSPVQVLFHFFSLFGPINLVLVDRLHATHT